LKDFFRGKQALQKIGRSIWAAAFSFVFFLYLYFGRDASGMHAALLNALICVFPAFPKSMRWSF
jgi:hypothetical protein